MAYLALYRKWRPQTFSEVVGQKHISAALQRAVGEDRLAHAYLFSGPRGTGKTSMAKILAKAVNCEHPRGADPCNECRTCREITGGSSLDVYEIDAASNRGIEEIRALRDSVRSLPSVCRKKVYIIDEVHMLTKEAFNALLKTLEEPPSHVLFILATTEPEKIPLTILSRCQRYEFRRISADDIREHLLHIAEASGFTLDSDAAGLIAVRAEGGLRDALSLLDQCMGAAGGKRLSAAMVYDLLGLTGKDRILSLAGHILRRESGEALTEFSAILQDGKEPAAVLSDLLSHFRDVMIARIQPDAPELSVYGDQKPLLMKEAETISEPYLDALFESLHGSLSEAKRSASPRMNAEMGLLRLCRLRGDRTLEGLVERIESLERQLRQGMPAAAAGMPAPAFTPRPSAAAAIPTLGGSFTDTGSAVSAAWQSGRSVSEMLDELAAEPAAQPAPTMTRPVAETTQDSFTVPQQGEAARVRVSTAVGNSASAPIHTPPSAAKADPNAMRLPTSEEQPPEPYCYPSVNLFNPTRPDDEAGAAREMKKNADILVNTLDSFGVKTTMLDICRGPSVTRYELQPQAGIKVSRITSLADDIALNLATAGVRIEAPIPGKPAVGIEVPNKIRSTVNIRSVFESQNYVNMRSPLTMALGKDIAGTAQVADLCKMPHLLIAGSTGSGKSVCVNSIIISFLFRSGPEDVKLILIDPKVVELAEYNGIPHLLMPVVTEPRKAAGALGASVAEMERRYKLFAENNVREIKAYNKLAAQTGMEHLPYIAIVIDELADLMMVAGKEVEDYICRIAQKARAAGIHLIVATQRPSVDVITGLIKANIPSRIAFAVSSQIDSRTILDSGGAEKLLGNGDMLFLPVGASKPVRVQGTFVTDEEIGAVLSFIKSTSSAQYDEEMIAEMERRAVAEKGSKKGSDDDGDAGGALDAMFEQAVECVIDAGQASTSLLQRRCKLGYARAARIMDQMEQEKIIGPYEGAKPRAVLVTKAEWEERKLGGQYDE